MPIKQLEAPCWQPCGPAAKPDDGGQHWATSGGAAECADPGDTMQAFAEPCWTVACDGNPGDPCGGELESIGECWTVHALNAADLGNFAELEGWEVSKDGIFRCAECVEALAEEGAAS
jgi:hypothetical protein